MVRMKRLRRAAQAVTIVLGVTWSLFGVLPHQSSALSPALSNAIEANAIEVRLVAQNFNVLADTQFRFTVGVPDADVRNQLEQDPSTTLRITAFAPLTTREQVRLISAGADPVGQLAVADLQLIQLSRTETNNYTAFLSTTARTNSLRLTKDGIYPIQISFVRSGEPISKLNTFVNFFNSSIETTRLPISIASTITVPQGSSLAIIGKDTPLYLEENRSITVTAAAINSIDVVASYETIS